MIVAYAMGGGLGHLRRARAVLDRLAPGSDRVFLTASRFAGGDGVIRVPRRLADFPAAFARWLRQTLHSLRPEAVLVDAFPLGILGELADASVLPDVPLWHSARLLRWDRYRAAFSGAPRRYDAVFAVEEPTPDHEVFLRAFSREFSRIDLAVEKTGNPREKSDKQAPHWLVVHSGPAAEVHRLLEFASGSERDLPVKPEFLVVSPRDISLPRGAARISHPRAWELFAHAGRIVTACGFNAMREAAPYAGKHLFLPFARRFDDQPLRAARRRRALAECAR